MAGASQRPPAPFLSISASETATHAMKDFMMGVLTSVEGREAIFGDSTPLPRFPPHTDAHYYALHFDKLYYHANTRSNDTPKNVIPPAWMRAFVPFFQSKAKCAVGLSTFKQAYMDIEIDGAPLLQYKALSDSEDNALRWWWSILHHEVYNYMSLEKRKSHAISVTPRCIAPCSPVHRWPVELLHPSVLLRRSFTMAVYEQTMTRPAPAYMVRHLSTKLEVLDEKVDAITKELECTREFYEKSARGRWRALDDFKVWIKEHLRLVNNKNHIDALQADLDDLKSKFAGEEKERARADTNLWKSMDIQRKKAKEHDDIINLQDNEMKWMYEEFDRITNKFKVHYRKIENQASSFRTLAQSVHSLSSDYGDDMRNTPSLAYVHDVADDCATLKDRVDALEARLPPKKRTRSTVGATEPKDVVVTLVKKGKTHTEQRADPTNKHGQGPNPQADDHLFNASVSLNPFARASNVAAIMGDVATEDVTFTDTHPSTGRVDMDPLLDLVYGVVQNSALSGHIEGDPDEIARNFFRHAEEGIHRMLPHLMAGLPNNSPWREWWLNSVKFVKVPSMANFKLDDDSLYLPGGVKVPWLHTIVPSNKVNIVEVLDPTGATITPHNPQGAIFQTYLIQPGLSVFCAPMGTHKTRMGVEMAHNLANFPSWNPAAITKSRPALFIAPSRAVCNMIVKLLTDLGFNDVVLYSNVVGTQWVGSYRFAVICYNSLRFKWNPDMDFSLFWVSEAEQLAGQMDSSFMNTRVGKVIVSTAKDKIAHFNACLKSNKGVRVLESASCSTVLLAMAQQAVGLNFDMVFNLSPPQSTKEFLFYPDFKMWVTTAINALYDGRHLFICCDCCADVGRLLTVLSAFTNSAITLTSKSTPDVRSSFTDLAQVIADFSVVIVSPALTTGVSDSVTLDDAIWAGCMTSLYGKSINAEEALQQNNRIRKVEKVHWTGRYSVYNSDPGIHHRESLRTDATTRFDTDAPMTMRLTDIEGGFSFAPYAPGHKPYSIRGTEYDGAYTMDMDRYVKYVMGWRQTGTLTPVHGRFPRDFEDAMLRSIDWTLMAEFLRVGNTHHGSAQFLRRFRDHILSAYHQIKDVAFEVRVLPTPADEMKLVRLLDATMNERVSLIEFHHSDLSDEELHEKVASDDATPDERGVVVCRQVCASMGIPYDYDDGVMFDQADYMEYLKGAVDAFNMKEFDATLYPRFTAFLRKTPMQNLSCDDENTGIRLTIIHDVFNDVRRLLRVDLSYARELLCRYQGVAFGDPIYQKDLIMWDPFQWFFYPVVLTSDQLSREVGDDVYQHHVKTVALPFIRQSFGRETDPKLQPPAGPVSIEWMLDLLRLLLRAEFSLVLHKRAMATVTINNQHVDRTSYQADPAFMAMYWTLNKLDPSDVSARVLAQNGLLKVPMCDVDLPIDDINNFGDPRFYPLWVSTYDRSGVSRQVIHAKHNRFAPIKLEGDADFDGPDSGEDFATWALGALDDLGGLDGV